MLGSTVVLVRDTHVRVYSRVSVGHPCWGHSRIPIECPAVQGLYIYIY